MKKIITILLCLLLCGCQKIERTDYYIFELGNYTIAVGYDNVEFIKIIFDFDIKDTLQGYEEVNDVDLMYMGKYFGKASFKNMNKKEKPSDEAILTSFEVYLEDTGFDDFKINDTKIDESIINNCNSYNGQLIERNGYACVIEQEVHKQDNAIILYGNIANIKQDTVDRIQIKVQ